MKHQDPADSHSTARRKALKTLAAATGIAALPIAWSKAGVKLGTLPLHAQASGVVHTLECALDINMEPDGDALTSSCAISPPTAGITMRWQINFLNAVFEGADISTGTVVTDGSGIAQVTSEPISSTSGVGQVSFTWTFENPSQGDGSCTQRYLWA